VAAKIRYSIIFAGDRFAVPGGQGKKQGYLFQKAMPV
jgi:hypothetical protein